MFVPLFIKPIDTFGGNTEVVIIVCILAIIALAYYKHTYKKRHSAQFEAYHKHLLRNRPEVLAKRDRK